MLLQQAVQHQQSVDPVRREHIPTQLVHRLCTLLVQAQSIFYTSILQEAVFGGGGDGQLDAYWKFETLIPYLRRLLPLVDCFSTGAQSVKCTSSSSERGFAATKAIRAVVVGVTGDRQVSAE